MGEGLTKLIQRVSQGDQAVFNQFYDAARPLIRGVLFRVLGTDDVEAIEQEVSVELWQRAQQFDRTRAPAAAWVVMVARARAMDHLRQRKVRRNIEGVSAEGMDAGTDDSGISALLFRTELQGQVRSVVDGLADEHSVVIDLCFFGGLSHVRAAETLGLPLGTVKSRVRAALVQLAEVMEPVE